jgi:hypothetical protein
VVVEHPIVKKGTAGVGFAELVLPLNNTRKQGEAKAQLA